MLKKTITYTDYDGVKREEDFYFNLSKAELTEMEMITEGGLQKKIDRITKSRNGKEIIDLFKDIILRSYGEKSDDGRRFIKNKELAEAFSQTEAYTELFMELATDADAAGAFINGIIPAEIAEQVQKEAAKAGLSVVEDNTAKS